MSTLMQFFPDDPFCQQRGLRIITGPNMTEQWRRPRSKRKRIQNKWKKQPGNHRPSNDILINAHGIIYCHPSIAPGLRQQLGDRLA